MVIGAAAVAAVAAIIGLIFLISGAASSSADAYVYLSGGHYELVTNLNGEESVEVASSRSDISNTSLAAFSEDGKYFYYYSKYDTYEDAGSLYKAEYGKLKEGSSKNGDYIELIASNVKLGFIQADGGVLYRKSEDSLYYYINGESKKIANSVNAADMDDKGRIVYSVGDNYEEQTLYGVYLNDIDNKVKLASDFGYILDWFDFDNILYVKYAENEDSYTVLSDIYVTGFGKESERIAKDVSEIVSYSEGTVYYTVANKEKLSLYDYVTDTYAEADSKLKEPELDDYATVVYNYYPASMYDRENYYDELYTTCTKPTNFYYNMVYDYYYAYDSGYFDYLEEAENVHLNLDWDKFAKVIVEVHDNTNDDSSGNNEHGYAYFYGSDNSTLEYAAQNDPFAASKYSAFVTKYKSMEDENGLIPVTDAVKKDLQALAKDCYSYKLFNSESSSEPYDGLWMTLCVGMINGGKSYDYDSYYDDLDKYYEADDRIWLREALQNKDNAVSTYTLYCYKGGNISTVNSEVTSTGSRGGAVMYNTAGSVTEKLDINDIYSVYDVRALFDMDYERELTILLPESGKQVTMTDSAADTIVDILVNYNGSIYFADNRVFATDNTTALYSAEISGDQIGAFTAVADDVTVCKLDGDVLYYFADCYSSSSSSTTYGSLYRFSGGSAECLAQDIIASRSCVRMYEDKVLTVYKGYRNGGYELSLIDASGSSTYIADDVTQYVRVNPTTIMYISDGDLYVYDGNKNTLIGEYVDCFWSLNRMEDTL